MKLIVTLSALFYQNLNLWIILVPKSYWSSPITTGCPPPLPSLCCPDTKAYSCTSTQASSLLFCMVDICPSSTTTGPEYGGKVVVYVGFGSLNPRNALVLCTSMMSASRKQTHNRYTRIAYKSPRFLDPCLHSERRCFLRFSKLAMMSRTRDKNPSMAGLAVILSSSSRS